MNRFRHILVAVFIDMKGDGKKSKITAGLVTRWSSNILVTWCEELTQCIRPWWWERWKAGREGDDRGWDGWMVSPTPWAWVWVSSGSLWGTRRPGVLRSVASQRVGHDWATELNGRRHFRHFPLISSMKFLYCRNIRVILIAIYEYLCFIYKKAKSYFAPQQISFFSIGGGIGFMENLWVSARLGPQNHKKRKGPIALLITPLPPSFPSWEMTQAAHKKEGELSHAMSAHCLGRCDEYIVGKLRKSWCLFFELVKNYSMFKVGPTEFEARDSHQHVPMSSKPTQGPYRSILWPWWTLPTIAFSDSSMTGYFVWQALIMSCAYTCCNYKKHNNISRLYCLLSS